MKVGDKVTLKKDCKPLGGFPEHNNKTAVITAFLESIEGGVYLKEGLRGCRYWNIDDLKLVKKE